MQQRDHNQAYTILPPHRQIKEVHVYGGYPKYFRVYKLLYRHSR